MNTLRFIIADNNNNGNNNMLHLIPVVTIPLTISILVNTFYKNTTTIIRTAAEAITKTQFKAETICAALVAIAIVYLFNMILEEVGNRLDNTFNKLKTEIREKDELIAKLLQQQNPKENQ